MEKEKSAAMERFEKEVQDKINPSSSTPAQVSEKQAERDRQEEKENHLNSLNIEGHKYKIDLDKEDDKAKSRGSEANDSDFKLYDEDKHISEMTQELKQK